MRTSQVGRPGSEGFGGFDLGDLIVSAPQLRLALERFTGRRPGRPHVVRPRPAGEADRLDRLLAGVRLAKFESSVLDPERGRYVYEVGLDADRPVGVLLTNPRDTVLTFGGPDDRRTGPRLAGSVDRLGAVLSMATGAAARGGLRRMARGDGTSSPGVAGRDPGRTPTRPAPGSTPTRTGRPTGTGPVGGGRPTTPAAPGGGGRRPPIPGREPAPTAVDTVVCDLNVRMVVDGRQHVELLQLYGRSIWFHLSRGLVDPVEPGPDGQHRSTGRRLGVALGTRTVTLAPDRVPRLSAPLDLGGETVRISGSGIVARLRTAGLGGTADDPRLVFSDVEVL